MTGKKILSLCFIFMFFLNIRVSSQELDEILYSSVAYNYSLMSLVQIETTRDSIVAQREREGIINNLNLRSIIRSDLKDAFLSVKDFASKIEINNKDLQLADEEYEMNMKNAIYSSFPNPVALLSPNPYVMIANGLQVVGSTFINYQQKTRELDFEKEKKAWELKKNILTDLEDVRSYFISTAYEVFNDYDIPDKYRLSEKQSREFVRDVNFPNPDIRIQRFEDKKEFFTAYPPFWYYYGEAATKIGNRELALKCYDIFFNSYIPILRKDPYVVGVTMSRLSLLAEEGIDISEKDMAISDIKKLLKHSNDKDWGNYIFASMMYAELDDYKKALSTIDHNRIYASEITQEAVDLSNKIKVSIISGLGTDEEKRKYLNVLLKNKKSNIQELFYITSSLADTNKMNITEIVKRTMQANNILLTKKSYVGFNVKKWNNSAYRLAIPKNWLDTKTMFYLIGSTQEEEDNSASNIDFVKKYNAYNVDFELTHKIPIEQNIKIIIKDPRIEIQLIFEPLFYVKNVKGDKDFNNYQLRHVNFNNLEFIFNRESNTFEKI